MSETHQIISLLAIMMGIILGAYGYATKAVSDMKKETEERIKRVYERFDEYKKNIEGRIERTCVVKDMCVVMHNTNDVNIKRIEESMVHGFNTLSAKIDDVQKQVILAVNNGRG